jgi:hypothetical protein
VTIAFHYHEMAVTIRRVVGVVADPSFPNQTLMLLERVKNITLSSTLATMNAFKAAS